MMDYAMRLFLSSFIIFSLYTSCIQAKEAQYVTCGSVLKLVNLNNNVRLHSPDIKYGTGSGQQIVTAINVQEDGDSYWFIKAELGKQCTRGRPIKCGEIIRLEHITSKKNLHSHKVNSPLSGKQEVSVYGDKGEGDTGDNWILICHNEFWERDDAVSLQHVDTESYLALSGRGYTAPINGHLEVVGERARTPSAQWTTMEGLFIHPNDFSAQHQHYHSEL